MSRKNKNGSRRNYSPRTYSRDFLKPTPIERAIQEVNKPASPQAVAVSDRIACDDKCSYEYKRMPAAWLETDFSYQRKIDAARVERIVNSFDPRLANEVKVSFRDGKFYVFDGAHTLSALKRIHGEEAFMVDCKVYYGLSYEDEAYLFALQSGESTRIHIRSETLADQRMQRLYGVPLLDSETRGQFIAARCAMERFQTDYALRLACPTEGGAARLDLDAA